MTSARTASIVVVMAAGMAAPAAMSADALARGTVPAGYRTISSISFDDQSAIHVIRVDSDARRLYAGSEDGVEVIDIDSDKKLGRVEVRGRVGGIALAPGLNRGFASNAADGSVVVFALDTLQTVRVVRSIGVGPGEIAYDPRTRRAFVSGSDGKLTVLGGDSLKSAGAVSLGGRLGQAVADNRGSLFVTDVEHHVLHVVDTERLVALGQMSVWPGLKPYALALDDKERRIYVACENGRMIVMDPDVGQMVGYLPIGTGKAGLAVEFAPNRLVRMFIPTTDGAVTVSTNLISTLAVEKTMPVDVRRTGAAAFDAKSGRVFLAGEPGILVIAK